MAILFCGTEHLFNFGGTFLRNDFEFGSVLEEKDVVYRCFLSLALVAIYSAMQNSLCNFKRGHFEKHFYEMMNDGFFSCMHNSLFLFTKDT